MDNNEVYSLFEDIKNDLKSINGKLENAPKVTNNQSGGQAYGGGLDTHKGAVWTVPQGSIRHRQKPC